MEVIDSAAYSLGEMEPSEKCQNQSYGNSSQSSEVPGEIIDMAGHNMLCDNPHCDNPADFFSLTEINAKEKRCNEHVNSIIRAYQTAHVIAAYDFIDSPQDAEEYYHRKERRKKGKKNLRELMKSCDEEAKAALATIDHEEQEVIETVHRHYEEVRVTVKTRQATLLAQFQAVRQDLDHYLADKRTALSLGAVLMCHDAQCRARFIGLGIAHVSDTIAGEIVNSWKVLESDINASLMYLNRQHMAQVASHLWDVAICQATQGVTEAIPFSLDYADASNSPTPQLELVRSTLLNYAEKSQDDRLNLLQKSWDLRQQLALRNAGTVAIGLQLAPLISLLQGRHTDAEGILQSCIEFASQLPEEVTQARVQLCGVKFHCGEFAQVQEIGSRLFDTQLTPEQYWTTLFYLSHSPESCKKPAAVANLAQWMEIHQEGPFPSMVKLMITVLSLEKGSSESEKMRLRAQGIADRHFPISKFAACNLALLAVECSDDRRAIGYSKQCRRIYSVIAPMSIDAAHNLCHLAARYSNLKKWRKAEDCLRLAQTIFSTSVLNSIYEGSSYSQMGVLYRNQSLWTQAESAHKRAQEMFEKYAAKSDEAATNYARMGLLCKLQKRWNEAREHYEHAQFIYNETAADSLQSADNLTIIGKLDEQLGNYRDAEQIYATALQLYQRHQARDCQAEALESLHRVAGRSNCQVF